MLRKYIVGLAGAGLAVGASTGIAVAANGSPPANAPSATHSARPAAVSRGITGTTAQAPETSTTVPDGHDAANHDAVDRDAANAADHEHADAVDHDAADHDAADHEHADAPDNDAANHDAANHQHEHAGAPVTSTTLAMNAITGVHRGRDGRDDHNQVDQNDNRGRGSNASHGGGHGPN
jgi:hypothetical protein